MSKRGLSAPSHVPHPTGSKRFKIDNDPRHAPNPLPPAPTLCPQLPQPPSSSHTMLNPCVPPFTPRRPGPDHRSSDPNYRSSAAKKRARLLTLFPLNVRSRHLNNTRCAQIRILRKQLIARLAQLKVIAELRKSIAERYVLPEEQAQVLSKAAAMVHSVFITDPRPAPVLVDPFDGRKHWKSIKIHIVGISPRHFSLQLDFSSYVTSVYYWHVEVAT